MNLGGPIWEGFSGSYALPEDEAHVWRASLDMAASGLSKLRPILSPNEQERADLFYFEADRWRRVIGRGSLRVRPETSGRIA